MTLSHLRSVLLITVAAAFSSGCGGESTFEIAGSVEGLIFPGLVLKDIKSGQSVTISDINQKSFSFPNTIGYATEYNVEVATQPPHQTCSPVSGTADTAGRHASINAVFLCSLTLHTVGGSITMAADAIGSYAGLKLINGSNDATPLEIVEGTTLYSYSNITFDTPYGITIFAQPSDESILCKLVPAKPEAHRIVTEEKISGVLGDEDLVINVECGPKAKL